MKRRRKPKIKIPDAICVADVHLREDVPICRTDDFDAAQWKKLLQIKKWQEEFNCVVLCSGDLYDFWKPSPELLGKTIENIPAKFYSVYGNHDLPQHSLDNKHRSGLYVLGAADAVTILPGRHWAQKEGISLEIKGRKILVWHVMTYAGKKLYPGMTAPKSISLLKKETDVDLIVTGDNHIPFHEYYDGRVLVNPGSMTRQSAKETHTPGVYFWYADTNTVERVELPHEKGVITREHIEKVAERDDRIDAFINTLDVDFESEMSFEDNLEMFFNRNKTKTKVKEIIYKSLE